MKNEADRVTSDSNKASNPSRGYLSCRYISQWSAHHFSWSEFTRVYKQKSVDSPEKRKSVGPEKTLTKNEDYS
jgi:hypothetical protein